MDELKSDLTIQDSERVIRRAEGTHDLLIKNARIVPATHAGDNIDKTWSILCQDGRVARIEPFSSDPNSGPGELGSSATTTGSTVVSPKQSGVHEVDAKGGLLIPSFCHAHIHLDKCFILDQCGELLTGDFHEAMHLTKSAKSTFPSRASDLYARGARLIRESVEYGVTSMRAFVEVDEEVGFACLDVGLRLKEEFKSVCEVQIAVFAQEALFSSVESAEPGPNFRLLKEAAGRAGVSVIGSAPYVEPSVDHAKRNIRLVFDIVDTLRVREGHLTEAPRSLEVDFHLDYNLDPGSEPLIYEVIKLIKERYYGVPDSRDTRSEDVSPAAAPANNVIHGCPRITVGHATRLQMFSSDEWVSLLSSIASTGPPIPITFVALPQSDIYMQGRAHMDEPLGAPRGTLRVPFLKAKYGVDVAMSVNNVDNAFTPQGSLDPLSLCSFGVALFQSAREEDLRTLLRSVTLTARRAIGSMGIDTDQVPSADLAPSISDRADLVILHGRESVRSAVLNPPFDRTTIKGGKVVALRRSTAWVA
ncbi:hypothetical protein D9613_005861 [Agrocybe pediades]|uniref:Metallo-dependent hydrolase n=1 Tax=Agrocybe pediades TaxID=84607 RepID=A0A8H4VR52_9AGAR|nr:hypothetical protein D9613_005861 [Agrocybe pediades]